MTDAKITFTFTARSTEILGNLLANAVQALYDDPYSSIDDDGLHTQGERLKAIVRYHQELEATARELGLDFDAIVKDEATMFEREEMDNIFAEAAQVPADKD